MTGIELKEFREREGLTQIELAKKLGVAQSKISAWESGVRKIPPYIEKHIECLKRLEDG